MQFQSTRNPALQVSLSEAMQAGLAPDGGLFIPNHFPTIAWQDFKVDMPYAEFATQMLTPFFAQDELAPYLAQICRESFNFPVPVVELDEQHSVLELFHGPTLSFKDFGARFLANSLSHIKNDKPFTILVATSGDTGSAVAAAFHGKSNIRVVVMFPEGKISQRQERQMTCWGDNIQAVAVKGMFDDCQTLVKQAFVTPWWSKRTTLNTSNSINIGRLLPQSTYYAYTSWQHFLKTGKKANFIVPSGNIGNITAAFWAKTMGFPIDEIVMSQNANDTISEYLTSGEYRPKASQETLANAMDVGNPSNFERLQHLLGDYATFKSTVRTFCTSDSEIKTEIKRVYQDYGMTICPHTATGFYARQHLPKDRSYIIVATAHPAKFESVIEPILGFDIAPTPALQALLDRPQHKVLIDADMDALCKVYQN